MPIYEYTCEKCSRQFDQLIRAAADEQTNPPCPECGSTKTERALSVFAVGGGGAAKSAAADDPTCGRCGGAPGSCGMG